jgi:hypothetical protein
VVIQAAIGRSMVSIALGSPERYEHLLPDRKHRLLVCGLCRQVAPLLNRPELLSVLETSEAFADGLAGAEELGRARQFALDVARSHAAIPEQEKFALAVAMAASVVPPSSRNLYKTVEPTAAGLIGRALDSLPALLASKHAPAGYPALFDEVEPRLVRFDAAWRTDTALSVARLMYDSREFSAMPILADALQDAGCDNDSILNHCRDTNQTHVCGCWVVDAVLGKE